MTPTRTSFSIVADPTDSSSYTLCDFSPPLLVDYADETRPESNWTPKTVLIESLKIRSFFMLAALTSQDGRTKIIESIDISMARWLDPKKSAQKRIIDITERVMADATNAITLQHLEKWKKTAPNIRIKEPDPSQ